MAKRMFVVYNTSSTMPVKYYKQEKRARDLASENEAWAYTGEADYNKNVVKQVEKVNLMSGKKYMEASNTPSYLSPASEVYWSM